MKISKELIELVAINNDITFEEVDFSNIGDAISSDIVDIISAYANKAIGHGWDEHVLTGEGCNCYFYKELAQDFIKFFNINPYNAKDFLELLYGCLLSNLESEAIEDTWGKLKIDSEGNLVLALKLPDTKETKITKMPIKINWLD